MEFLVKSSLVLLLAGLVQTLAVPLVQGKKNFSCKNFWTSNFKFWRWRTIEARISGYDAIRKGDGAGHDAIRSPRSRHDAIWKTRSRHDAIRSGRENATRWFVCSLEKRYGSNAFKSLRKPGLGLLLRHGLRFTLRLSFSRSMKLKPKVKSSKCLNFRSLRIKLNEYSPNYILYCNVLYNYVTCVLYCTYTVYGAVIRAYLFLANLFFAKSFLSLNWPVHTKISYLKVFEILMEDYKLHSNIGDFCFNLNNFINEQKLNPKGTIIHW